jgi:hypothetical protein
VIGPHQVVRVLGVVALVLSFIHPAIAQFETRGSLAVQVFPVSVAVGDFNHDGKLDLAVASVDSSTGFATDIQVLLGNGDGTFQPAVDYSVGTAPGSVAVADFNHDGNLDLVVTNALGDSVSVLLGDGDGTFQPAITFPTPPDPIFVAVGDFNGDGNIDVATVNLSDNTGRCDCVAIFLGNGDGTFQQPPIITTPLLFPSAIGIGRFTAGKSLDIAVAEEFGQTSQMEILLGNGDGTFRHGAVYPVGPSSASIAVADFNGDHKADLAVAEYEGVGIGIFLGNGDGTFKPRVDYETNSPYWVVAADLNGDNKEDLVVANLVFPSGVTVFTGNGDGTFGKGTYYPDGQENRFVATGDFNGDHRTDIVVADYGSDTIITMLNTGVVAFSPTTPLVLPVQLINTTGPPDVVTLTNNGTTALSIRSIKVSGEFQVSSTCGTSVAPGANCAISVVFRPTSVGTHSGLVTVVDSASSKAQVIEVSGSGTIVKVLPGSLNFGSQKVGTKSKVQMVTITNEGSSTFYYNTVGIGGADTKDFSETDNCTGHFIPPGGVCEAAVAFTPTKTGVRTGTLYIVPKGTTSPQPVTLTGTGT